MRRLRTVPPLLAPMLLAHPTLAQPADQAPNTMAARVLACAPCHGAQGQGIQGLAAQGQGVQALGMGSDAFPRLSGKPAGYLFNQLVAFRDGRRRYPPMNYLLEYLPDPYLHAMADHFAAQCSATIKVRTPVNQDEKVFCRLRRREGEARPKAQATENLA